MLDKSAGRKYCKKVLDFLPKLYYAELDE